MAAKQQKRKLVSLLRAGKARRGRKGEQNPPWERLEAGLKRQGIRGRGPSTPFPILPLPNLPG